MFPLLIYLFDLLRRIALRPLEIFKDMAPLRNIGLMVSRPTSTISSVPPTAPRSFGLTNEQRRRAEQLVNVFEYGTPTTTYDTIVALNDGRGYTAGRAGFTTATGDAQLVIERYQQTVPAAPLGAYLPIIRRLSAEENGDIRGLEGFPEAWKQAAKDARFRAAQDAIHDELYFIPAMEEAEQLGVTSASGKAIFYDTIIQHGGGTSSDSLSGIIQRATNTLGGTPKSGVRERVWLQAFLEARRSVLLRPANQATQDAWAASAGRVDILLDVLQSNPDLTRRIVIDTDSYEAVIR